jgi:serine protease Do
LGNPTGRGFTVSRGIVSAIGRDGAADGTEDFIQTDAAINRGNSGGPLLNRRGQVIGVNTVIRSDGRGISFAVPSNVVKRVIAQLNAHGYVARGYLGLTPSSITPELRDGLKLGDVQGVVVADVSNNFPAARAGIQPYDVITRFNGHAIRQSDDFFTCVSNTPPQQQVEIEVLRGGRPMKFYPTLDQRPNDVTYSSSQIRPASDKRGQTGGQNSDLSLGFSVRANSPEVLRDLRVNKVSEEISGGVIISEVDPLGPAADSRLAPGYVVLEANRQAIRDLSDFQRATETLRQGDILVLRFTAPYQRAIRFAAIKIGEN